MKADGMTESAVMAVLDRLAEAYMKRDMDGLLASFAPDPDVVLYGTGADEKRVGQAEIKAQAERDWSQAEAVSVAYEWTSVSTAGPVAWVATDGAFEVKAGGEGMRLPARMTFVLERRGGQWLIVQAHFSFPAAAQEEAESFTT